MGRCESKANRMVGLKEENEIKRNNCEQEMLRFKLKEDKIGCILRTTLEENKSNNDCRMLCRFCGIDVGDGLKAKIDDRNVYYDSTQDAFTFLEEFMNWTQFGIFKQWIRTNDIKVLECGKSELQGLHSVCMFLGMDGLSQALYDHVSSIDKVEYGNPMDPSEDDKLQFLWMKSPDFVQDHNHGYHVEQWREKTVSNGYSQVGRNPDDLWWRKPK